MPFCRSGVTSIDLLWEGARFPMNPRIQIMSYKYSWGVYAISSARMFLVVMFLAFCLGRSSHAAGLYKPGVGPHAVEVIDTEFAASGADPIPLRIYVPSETGRYPVIVFSHGAGDSQLTAPALMYYWASHGYVCVLPKHAAIDEKQKGLVSKILRLEKEFGNNRMDKWAPRIKELHAVLDAADEAETALPTIANKLDTKHVAIAGHSLGARVAMLLAGTIVYTGEEKRAVSLKEKRIAAALLMSPVGPNGSELTNDSWGGIDIPMMVMSASRDIGALAQGEEWRSDQFLYSKPGDKYQVYLNGGNHLTYIGPPRTNDPAKYLEKGNKGAPTWFNHTFPGLSKATLFNYVCSSSLAFWDAYLKNDSAAKAFLSSSDLESASGELAWLDRR
jgi:predicted dienelactone hydrolase